MGVPGGHQGVEGEEAGGPVVGVEAVAAPGVVAEQHVGPHGPDDPGHRPALVGVVDQLAVDLAEELHPVAGRRSDVTAEQAPAAAARHSRLRAATSAAEVGVGVPAALGPVGEHEVVDLAAGGRPAGERGAGAELDVVGVGADGQRRPAGPAGRR